MVKFKSIPHDDEPMVALKSQKNGNYLSIDGNNNMIETDKPFYFNVKPQGSINGKKYSFISDDGKYLSFDGEDEFFVCKKKGMSMKKKVAIGVLGVGGVVVIVATGGTALLAAGAVGAAGKGLADNPDSKVTKMVEGVPVVGYLPAAAHLAKGDKDRAKRAAAKCTNSTVVTGVVVGAVAATVATGGAAAVAGAAGAGAAGAVGTAAATAGVAAAAGATAGAAGGALGVAAESQIAKHINDGTIKDQCLKGTKEDYINGVKKGAVKGAISGATAGLAEGLGDVLEAAEKSGGMMADVAEVAKDAKEIKDKLDYMGEANGVSENIAKGMVEEVQGGLQDVAIETGKDQAKKAYNKIDGIEEKIGDKGSSDWEEYNANKQCDIRLQTGKGSKYICCDSGGTVKCVDTKDSMTVFVSIPQKDGSMVALKSKSDGNYLSIDKKGNIK
eukprot:CAMPEP_0201592078 /NCGR_PEP_ID=MMETSP0190_2-20130828/190070_1 /ASSEMBLY_ACC=CAM_ASM_000263 /TAXON_ID=37353 /ORGANISM="Rosalina sp." /LENGTH=442 /DNA_ID=CAMNT_0048050683 /DNA_START=1341 /DNA_END=2666 /DNA_ORIENTATION=-